MRAKINVIPFVPHDDFQDDLKPYQDVDSPYFKLIQSLAQQIEQLPRFTNVEKYLMSEFIDESGIEQPEGDVEIDVVVFDDPKVFYFSGMAYAEEAQICGFHGLSAGALETETNLSTRHRVMIAANKGQFMEHFKEFRQSLEDPKSGAQDDQFIRAQMTTLTHELCHAIEFIEHGNGLTPSEVESLTHHTYCPYKFSDFSTGWGFVFDISFDLENQVDDQFVIEIMEERVEKAGMEMMDKLTIDQKLAGQWLKELQNSPKPRPSSLSMSM